MEIWFLRRFAFSVKLTKCTNRARTAACIHSARRRGRGFPSVASYTCKRTGKITDVHVEVETLQLRHARDMWRFWGTDRGGQVSRLERSSRKWPDIQEGKIGQRANRHPKDTYLLSVLIGYSRDTRSLDTQGIVVGSWGWRLQWWFTESRGNAYGIVEVRLWLRWLLYGSEQLTVS